jgi:hypothetical protein
MFAMNPAPVARRAPGYARLAVVITTLTLLATLVPARLSAQAQTSSAQMIYGRVIDDKTRQSVTQAAVHLLDAGGRRVATVLTDQEGRFRFAPSQDGDYKLRAERIGFRTSESREFRLLKGEQITFDFYLSTQAVLLAPIEVKASTRAWAERYASALILPFYERKEFYEKLGAGKFFTRAQLADHDGLPLTALFTTVAGVHMASNGVTMRGGCAPQYYLNGMPLRLEPSESVDGLFSLADLEAVEIYRGASQLPAEFGGSTGECGAIVLWTRRSN